MFTGIVEELGEVVGKEDLTDAARFVIRGPLVTTDAGHGDSIAVNGISLTVSGLGQDWFEVSLIPTTLQMTTLGRAAVGTPVNLEVDVIAKYVERLLTHKHASTSDDTP